VHRSTLRVVSALSTSSTKQARVGQVQPHEHYVRAEELLKAAADHPDPSASKTLYLLRAAQVHATLAAATGPRLKAPQLIPKSEGGTRGNA
jgi:hypothetical protein